MIKPRPIAPNALNALPGTVAANAGLAGAALAALRPRPPIRVGASSISSPSSPPPPNGLDDDVLDGSSSSASASEGLDPVAISSSSASIALAVRAPANAKVGRTGVVLAAEAHAGPLEAGANALKPPPPDAANGDELDLAAAANEKPELAIGATGLAPNVDAPKPDPPNPPDAPPKTELVGAGAEKAVGRPGVDEGPNAPAPNAGAAADAADGAAAAFVTSCANASPPNGFPPRSVIRQPTRTPSLEYANRHGAGLIASP